ncbi:BtpA/SgcQ family protein [Streptomyces sp. SCSIO ZS0520]|uniref:BtpA/SgcQ family protein n=1 Tax=Streptomyces sp. SCSIO ZS0520 TaxID=2892996 RepID=UPI0021DB2030|nr:BtpA/SgcQ family protein [Streptomyces sp. SCSIO ZS0520]
MSQVENNGAAGGRPGKVCLGVVHLDPLPGTPFHEAGSFDRILDDAVASVRALYEGGAHGALLQTVDRVYSTRDESDPARIASMSVIARAAREATGDDFRIGVQLMRHATKASLAVAKVCGGDFVRATAVVGATVSTHGLVQADPLDVMEYRRKIDAWDVQVIADVDSMHFQWLGGGVPTESIARQAAFVGADVVCLGSKDEERTLETIAAVRRTAPGVPVFLAGHTDHENAARLMAHADGAFVSSCFNGWKGRIQVDKVAAYMDILRSLEDAA